MESRVLKMSHVFWTIVAFVVDWVLSCASIKVLAFGFVLAGACTSLGFATQEA